jgi:hypothetical protein
LWAIWHRLSSCSPSACALCSNIAFLLYGFNHALMPVMLLHAVLLPVNGWRLWEALQSRDAEEPTSEIVAQSSVSSGRLS